MLVITPSGPANEGQAYSLSCDLTGHESLAVTQRTFQWNRLTPTFQDDVSSTTALSFTPLSHSDGGEYRCTATITSPYLSGDHSISRTETIIFSRKLLFQL